MTDLPKLWQRVVLHGDHPYAGKKGTVVRIIDAETSTGKRRIAIVKLPTKEGIVETCVWTRRQWRLETC